MIINGFPWHMPFVHSHPRKNYSQLKRECFSIVFATERCNQYIYGQSFLVLNDNQPLKSFFTKAIDRAPPRIQRFLLRLQRYDFSMNYKPGEEIKVADALSRAHLQDSRTEIPDKELYFVVNSVISSLPISAKRLNDLKQETTKNDALQKLKDFTLNGWQKGKKMTLQKSDHILFAVVRYRIHIDYF